MATDMNMFMNRVKKLQKNLETKLEQSALVRDLKKYAMAKQKVIKRQIDSNADVKRALSYIEKRRKELDKVTRNLPKDVATVKKFVAAQRKEFEKASKQLIKELRAGDLEAAKKTAKRYGGTVKSASKFKMGGTRKRTASKSANA